MAPRYETLPQSDLDEVDTIAASGKLGTKVTKVERAPAPQSSRNILTASVALNVLLMAILLYLTFGSGNGEVSQFARLPRNIPKAWGLDHEGNQTEEAHLWDVLSRYDRGVIALSNEYAEQEGLPNSQRFPWDHSKGIYLLNAYHNLHCVTSIRESLLRYRDGQPQLREWGHIAHCLHVLRDDIICNADDTPRYSGLDQPAESTGLGQVRMCRDWTKLEEWADQHNSCWRQRGPQDMEEPEINRFRFCPTGSPYQDKVDARFGAADKE